MAAEIEKLREEHVNFRRLLDVLEKQLGVFHEGDTPDYPLMTDILHYMTHFPDHLHHPREDVIFARLVRSDSGVALRVQELARQHRVLAEAGARIHENLESVMNGEVMARSMIEAPGLLYVTYYRSHMDMEESDLFALAEAVLGDEDWKEIDAEIQSRPDPMFGHDIEERYRAVYQQIVQTVA